MVLLDLEGKLEDVFTARMCITAIKEMRCFSIDGDPFTYDKEKGVDGNAFLFQYWGPKRNIVEVTTYGFFYTLLHNVERLKEQMKSEDKKWSHIQKLYKLADDSLNGSGEGVHAR